MTEQAGALSNFRTWPSSRPELVSRLRIGFRSGRAWARSGVAPCPLPEFLVIGAQRSGTTSLYSDLAKHPQIVPAIGKELQYFTLFHRRSLSWYSGHFPRHEKDQMSFEASPYYLFHPYVPERVQAVLPTVKCIVLLRNPIDRAHSHYLHTQRLGHEPLSFEEALTCEAQRMAEAKSHGLDSRTGHRILRSYSYASRGHYAAQLERWYEHVSPDRIKVLRAEDYYTQPARMYGEICAFLELKSFTPEEFSHVTTRGRSASSEISGTARSILSEQLSDDTSRLHALVGWDHKWEYPPVVHPPAPGVRPV